MAGSFVIYEVYNATGVKHLFTARSGDVCEVLGISSVTLFRMRKRAAEGLYTPYIFKDITETIKYTVLRKGKVVFNGTRQQILDHFGISKTKFMNCKHSDNRSLCIYLNDDRLKGERGND